MSDFKRVAAMGLRHYPFGPGSAGAEKFASELYPRLLAKGYEITAYTRTYRGDEAVTEHTHEGVRVIPLRTVRKSGFDTLIHCFKVTWHIIRHNTADIVHIQNGGNSIWGHILRLAGKQVYLSMDGLDWQRSKWPWYGKVYLFISTYLTARLGKSVIMDNVFTQEWFETKFKRDYRFIPFGSEVPETDLDEKYLEPWGLVRGEYFLFIGRFIPEKGVHYIIEAFADLQTDKKMVLVGGSPNPSEYEASIHATSDERVIFPGFVYGKAAHSLMKYAYAYIQASDIEGLSPVLLEVMSLGTPIVCSDIPQNLYAIQDAAVTFAKGNSSDLRDKLNFSLENIETMNELATAAKVRSLDFSWDKVTDAHVELFKND